MTKFVTRGPDSWTPKQSNASWQRERMRGQIVPMIPERKWSIRKLTLGLSPLQITAVIAVFFVTSIGAVGLAWAMRKWNR